MNDLFIKEEVQFLLKLVLLTGFLYLINWYVLDSFEFWEMFFPIWKIYAFHVFSVFSVFSLVNYQYHKGKKQVFNNFMIATFIKMILVILFLLPLLLSEFENKKPDVLNFFVVYFIFLAFEITQILRFLNKEETL